MRVLLLLLLAVLGVGCREPVRVVQVPVLDVAPVRIPDRPRMRSLELSTDAPPIERARALVDDLASLRAYAEALEVALGKSDVEGHKSR